MKKLLLAALLLSGAAHAQQPSLARQSLFFSAPIVATSTYQVVLQTEGGRNGCLIQNTGANKMYVYIDGAAGSGTPVGLVTAFQVVAGGTFSCAVGGVVTIADKIWITGTAGDVYVVARQ